MSRLKQLIHEVHRRSLWQVLSVYLVSSWVTLQVADTVTAALGLPDWVPQAALVLLIVLLPVVLATAFVQEGVGGARAEPAPEAEKAEGEPTPELSTPEPRGAHHRVLTWRNAIAAAVVMLALLTVSAGGYMGLRAAGIGPFGTLMSKGVLEERDRIVLADFENRTTDSLLAIAVTELFRTGLSQSRVVNVLDAQSVTRVLERMERPSDALLDFDLACEVAIREGLKAVVAGELIPVGGSYVVSAQLVAAQSGETLWTDSETAPDAEAVITAVDRLTRSLRERVGESLRTVRRDEPLRQVTTSSLEALKKNTQASRAGDREGDYGQSIRLNQEAIELDSLFAMAYLGLGVAWFSTGAERSQWAGAFRKAFELSYRLPYRERYQIQGLYYQFVTEELDKAITALQAYQEFRPDRPLNNLGIVYHRLRDYERAEPIFLSLVERDTLSGIAYANLTFTQINLGKLDEATQTLARFRKNLPDHPFVRRYSFGLAQAKGEYEEAEAQVLALREQFRADPLQRELTSSYLSWLARLRGRLSESRSHLEDAQRASKLRGSGARYLEYVLRQALMELDPGLRGARAEALQMVEEALEQVPLNSIVPGDRPFRRLIEFYARTGQPDRARSYLSENERANHERVRTSQIRRHYGAAILAEVDGRWEDAIREYRLRDELIMTCTMCGLPDLAWAYDQAGEPDSALAIYERYIATPYMWKAWTDSWWLYRVYERLGDLYEQRGDTAKAIYYYGKLVDLWKDADPELQPRVEAARRAIEALSRDK